MITNHYPQHLVDLTAIFSAHPQHVDMGRSLTPVLTAFLSVMHDAYLGMGFPGHAEHFVKCRRKHYYIGSEDYPIEPCTPNSNCYVVRATLAGVWPYDVKQTGEPFVRQTL